MSGCMICSGTNEVRNIDLYIIGSEGLNVCHQCEMLIVKYINGLRTVAAATKINFMKQQKKRNKNHG